MAVSVSIRASFSPCWTGPAAGPGRALPAALMPAVFLPAARYRVSPTTTTTRGGAENHRREARQCMETWRRGFARGSTFWRPVRPTCFFGSVFVFKTLAPSCGAGENYTTQNELGIYSWFSWLFILCHISIYISYFANLTWSSFFWLVLHIHVHAHMHPYPNNLN